ncbi:YciI family protein [Ornithinimicrobium panacihumi]|uniref:YciI family protein n=1 Tax=Ornithinimicrobium panacihumi TaxID=2008449 RepID=UPI003F8B862C
MKHVVLLLSMGEMPPWEELSEEEQTGHMQRHDDFGQACREREGVQILAGEALDGTPTVVRVRGGERLVTDGPYAEAVEQLGGFYLVETPDLETLLELVELLPPYDIQLSPVGEE